MRYSVRSLFKHSIYGVGKIFIVGEKPKFFDYGEDIIHLPYKETQVKEVNIWEKVLHACRDERVSDEFFFMNDDYFFAQDFDMSEFPHFHKGNMRNFSWAKKPYHSIKGGYDKKCFVTMQLLESLGMSTWHFDIHTPNRVEKDKFIAAYEFFKPYLYQGSGLVISTCYANYHGLTPTRRSDCKLRRSELNRFFENEKPLVFSIFDDAQCPELLAYMSTTYPDKSPVER